MSVPVIVGDFEKRWTKGQFFRRTSVKWSYRLSENEKIRQVTRGQLINQYSFIKKMAKRTLGQKSQKKSTKYKIYDNVWQNKVSPNKQIRHDSEG